MKCKYCGSDLVEGKNFCPECGRDQSEKTEAPAEIKEGVKATPGKIAIAVAAVVVVLALLIAMLAGGMRVPITSMLFYGYPDMYTESAKMPTYDLAKAEELLKAEGYDASNPLEIELIAVEAEPGLEMFQSTLSQIGVDLTVTVLEHSVYLQREGSGEFDICYPAQAVIT